REVEGPELTALVAMHAVGDDSISILFVGCDLKARHPFWGRTDRSEVDLPGAQIEAGNAKHAVVHDGIGRIEERNMLARLANRIQQTPEANILHAGKIRLCELDAIYHLEIVCANDHDFVPELIQVLSVG